MRDYAIAPTAQRLAEENNVDWRVLEGSGEGGSVVERDVLGYLARVMQGEEATNPTPEPLPEGLSAWPEEPERRRGADRKAERTTNHTARRAESTLERPENQNAAEANQTAPFTMPPVAVVKPTPDAEVQSPWTVEKPAKPVADPAKASPRADSEAFSTVSETTVSEPAPKAAATLAPPAETVANTLSTAFSADDAEAHRAERAELETLRIRVAELEDERTKHVNELHQLSRMQETIALQKNEGTKLGALQSEVRDLKAQLAAAQRSSERAEALAAHNRDLEARLVRARNFKRKAKAEFERITEDNIMLEHELAGLKRSKRGLFRRS